jgi:hypothetical protein
MSNVIANKLRELGSTGNLLYRDFNDVTLGSRLSDVNMTRVRGSVRLANMRLILPVSVERARRKALTYSYK